MKVGCAPQPIHRIMVSKPRSPESEPNLGGFAADEGAARSRPPASDPPGASASQQRRRVRVSLRREEDDEAPPSGPVSAFASEEEGTQAQRRSSRVPIAVDDVGTTAVKLARGTRRDSAPRISVSRSLIAKAPIDSRAAFVLSLVDGRNSIEAIMDMAAMPADEVRSTLDRLARLGLITLP